MISELFNIFMIGGLQDCKVELGHFSVCRILPSMMPSVNALTLFILTCSFFVNLFFFLLLLAPDRDESKDIYFTNVCSLGCISSQTLTAESGIHMEHILTLLWAVEAVQQPMEQEMYRIIWSEYHSEVRHAHAHTHAHREHTHTDDPAYRQFDAHKDT